MNDQLQSARMQSMPRTRSTFAHMPAALFAAILGVALASCRPAADPPPRGPEVRLEFRTQPANAQVGIPLGTAPVLEVLDPDDELITRTAMTVRARVVTGSAQIANGAQVNVVNGVADFSDLVLVGPTNANVRLGFQLFEDDIPNEEAVAVADTFRLITGPATDMSAQSFTAFFGEAGQLASPTPAVIFEDPFGNPVPGVTANFVITAGEGRLTGSAQAVSGADGIATVSGWVLGLPGQNQIRAQRANMTDVVFTATASTVAGMLRVRLTGSPAGSTAKVRVRKTSAAGATHDVIYDIRDSLTVTGLPFGTYAVTGDSLKVGNRIWLADPGPTNLNVGATSGPSTGLSYREHGRFEITTRGLPTPTNSATLDFQPTAGESAVAFSVAVLNDAVTRGLGPIGTYNLVPRTVTVGGQNFVANPAQQSVVLSGGDTPTQATVNYAVTTGSLVVTLAGTLPQGAAPQIDVTGPGGFRETVFISTPRTWNGLAPGTYTIVASPITVAGQNFNPTPPTTVTTVTAGNATQVTITYNP
jgi:hypothetical protein